MTDPDNSGILTKKITMKKIASELISLVSMIAVGFIVIVIIFFVYYRIKDDKKIYKKEVGKELIIKDDTLLIINYSYLLDEYTLEDGRKVSSELVFNNVK